MPNREKKYWFLRKQNVAKPLGKRRAPEALIDLLVPALELKSDENAKESVSGIELGCGEGHLLGIIANSPLCRSLLMNLNGLDRDKLALDRAKKLFPKMNFLYQDLRKEWCGGLKPYDFVMIVNVLHEIVSEVLLENQQSTYHLARTFALKEFQELLSQCYTLLNPRGILILFDGVDTQDNSMVTFRFREPLGFELLQKFANEFRFCNGSVFVSSPSGEIKMSKKDLLRFLTKYDAILNSTWGIERDETYQTFTYVEMENAVRSAGFSLIHSELTIADLNRWESLIEPLSKGSGFPFQHVLIAGVKDG